MNLAAERKMELLNGFLESFSKHYQLKNMREHAQEVALNEKLAIRKVANLQNQSLERENSPSAV
jgi:hypothetical protein